MARIMLFHICTRMDWQEAQRRGEYCADSLAAEGFIHCSLAAQVIKTAGRFYRGQPGLVLLVIDPTRLTAEIKCEAADGELFPHVYGPLALGAVVDVLPFPPDANGTFRLPKFEDKEGI